MAWGHRTTLWTLGSHASFLGRTNESSFESEKAQLYHGHQKRTWAISQILPFGENWILGFDRENNFRAS